MIGGVIVVAMMTLLGDTAPGGTRDVLSPFQSSVRRMAHANCASNPATCDKLDRNVLDTLGSGLEFPVIHRFTVSGDCHIYVKIHYC